MSPTTGVLLMAYGTPNSLDEVEPYYKDIRGGRTPTPEQVQVLTEKYRKVGGRTPLLDITQEVAAALEQRLNGAEGDAYKVYVGMKHWHPYIAKAMDQIAEDGIEKLIAIPLAPHYSQMSTDGYRNSIEEALRSRSRPIPVRLIESWHANPLFIKTIAERIQDALKGFPPDEVANVRVVFGAHSLPRRIQQWDDPYQRELNQSCEAVARLVGLPFWQFSFQSASNTGEPWLGPDILETLSDLASQGVKHVLTVAIGFVADHLEILFDIDIEARELAEELGLNLKRTEMPNASPTFVDTLADLVTNGTGARIADLKQERVT